MTPLDDDEGVALARRLEEATPDDLLADLEERYDVDDPVPPGHVDSTTMAFAQRTPWRDGDPCELCGEDEAPEDPLGHFRRPGEFRGYVVCHAQCGEDQGLELA